MNLSDYKLGIKYSCDESGGYRDIRFDEVIAISGAWMTISFSYHGHPILEATYHRNINRLHYYVPIYTKFPGHTFIRCYII